jgi:hypothetical protein
MMWLALAHYVSAVTGGGVTISGEYDKRAIDLRFLMQGHIIERQ